MRKLNKKGVFVAAVLGYVAIGLIGGSVIFFIGKSAIDNNKNAQNPPRNQEMINKIKI